MSTDKINQVDTSAGPKGIGGWLVLPIIGFVGVILLTFKNLLETFSKENMVGLEAIFDATSGPLATLKIPLALSFIAGIIVIASASYCLLMIVNKDHKIVKFATVHYLILAVAGLVDLWAGFVLEAAVPSAPLGNDVIKGAMQGILVAAVWIPYFRKSRRVKNTFVKNGEGVSY